MNNISFEKTLAPRSYKAEDFKGMSEVKRTDFGFDWPIKEDK